MNGEADAVVIGAGVIGAAVALELSRRGVRTVVVDKIPAAGHGPTGNSCAIIRLHYSSLDGVAMAYEGAFYWRDWENYLGIVDELGMARYVDTGMILLKSATNHHLKAQAHYTTLGIPFEEWSREQLAERMPIFDLHAYWPPKRPGDPDFSKRSGATIDGAIFTPESGYIVDPALANHNVQRAAEKLGARFEFGRRVVEVLSDAERVRGVRLEDGTTIDAPIVVNVAGPHSYVLNRMAGVEDDMNVKTRALRHEVHHVPAPEGFDFEADGCTTSDGDTGIYFRPASGNHILVGSEDPECDPRVWVQEPDHYQRTVTESQWETQVHRLALRIPSLKIPTERKGIVDLYDVADDWIPIYDKSSLPGFYMAIGTSGNQFKNAGVVGELMAELITRVEDGHPHDEDPVRLPARYTGFELDAGFYSRLRTINRNSSFSVRG